MAHMSVAPGPVYPPQGHPVQGGSPGMAMTSVSVSLEFSAEGLKNKDLLGKSDPLVRLLVPKHPTLSAGAVGKHEWREVARTEVIANCTDPVWARRLKISYHFEQLQPLRFALVDVDNNTKGTGDSLGIADVTLGEIVRSGNLRLKLVSESGRDGKYGILTVRAHDDNAAGRVRVKLSFGGRNLDKKDTFGKSDPYFVLSRAEQGRMSVVHKSKHIMNNLNPDWPPHTAILYTSGMTWDQILMKCVVYDWDKYTPHDLIGEANFSLLQLSRGGSMPLINPAKKGKRKYRDSGTLQIHRADAVELPSFVSFLQGGMKLNFVVAVDFTASNRPPDNPQSLHYMGNPDRPSQYWQALNAVGRVLEGYIPDGYMTALGFGGILPGMGDTPSFDFALTGQPDPRVRGVGGLLEAYETAIRNVRLAGPTNFEPLLRNAMSLCDTNPVSQRNQHFSVVLILTDGIITDLENTIEAIIDASYTTPMAIVIVGIGTQNFSVMERLDGDKHKLKSNNGQREAKHDIVQFVKYAPERGIDVFAAEVLQEIPERIVEFMVDAGIKPGVHL